MVAVGLNFYEYSMAVFDPLSCRSKPAGKLMFASLFLAPLADARMHIIYRLHINAVEYQEDRALMPILATHRREE